MSYINEALKKAQKDRDSRYERFGGIIASGPVRTKTSVKRKRVIGAAIALIILIPTGLLIAVYLHQQPSPVLKGSSPPVSSGNQETRSAMVPDGKVMAMNPAVSTDAAAQAEKTRISEREVPTAVQADGKPFPGSATVSPVGSPNQREAEVRYLEALTAQRRRDHKRAEELYQQALVLDPGHVKALNNLGVLFMDQKNRRQAAALFNRAIALKKDYVDPYYNLACLYARVDETDESIRYLKMAIAINRDVKNWAEKDADMRSVVASDEFKKIREGQKN
jgi:tetratricopeptide (TPR) repeat protein